MFNTTFAENYSVGTGGGAYAPIVGSPPNASFTNCIFWQNQAGSAASVAEAQLYVPGAGANTITHSCIQDAAENDLNVPYNGSGTNIDLNPLFRDDTALPDGDFRLSYCSPAIDAGNSPAVPADSLDGDQDNDYSEKAPDLNILRRVVDALHVPNSSVSIPLPSTTLVVDLGAYEFPLLGDINDDEKVDGLDIQPFTHCIIDAAGGAPIGPCVRADMNDDGVLNFADVACFIPVLLGQTGCLSCGPGAIGGLVDCNGNETADPVDIALGTSEDCDSNGIPDECDLNTEDPDGNEEVSADVNGNDIPDECEPDCNGNHIPDASDISEATSNDVNSNDIPDECEPDCNDNDVPDAWDISSHESDDCNENGIPDECEVDCNGNDVPDDCDIANETSLDCNANGEPDECDVARSMLPSFDCNDNDVPDECDIANETSEDENENHIPDECEEAPRGDGEGGGEIDTEAAWEDFYEWYFEQMYGTPGDWDTLTGPERFERVMDELELLGLPYAAPW